MVNEYLVIVGSISLILALVEAWMLVSVFSNPGKGLSILIPGSQDLLKSHIDFLLMSLLLFVFYLLFSHFQIKAPALVILAMCLGAIGNPTLFLVRAIKPEWKENPSTSFRLMMPVSCLLTTAGFLGAAILAAKSAIALI